MKIANMKTLFSMMVFVICYPVIIHADTQPTPCMPYIGEQLSFDIGEYFINTVSLTMNITSMDNGWRVKSFARTNKVLDIFKKVRDYITAEGICVDGKMQSTLFDANLHERRYRAQKRTEFIWRKNQVKYTQHEITEYFIVPAGHLSIIDAFLAVRNLDLKAGQTLEIPIFDSRKRYEIQVNILDKTETLKAPWGEMVRCIIVNIKFKTNGIFTNNDIITLWMTDDARHIPIKLKAKIKSDHIYAHLTNYRTTSGRSVINQQ